jgi:hypothetical protein
MYRCGTPWLTADVLRLPLWNGCCKTMTAGLCWPRQLIRALWQLAQ